MPHKELSSSAQVGNLAYLRFIRIENTIIYDADENPKTTHEKLAKMAGVEERKGNKPVIDDGGWMKPSGDLISFTEDTNSCAVRGDVFQARDRTIQIAATILGADKVNI
jgi:hypothetical protein